MAYVGFGRDALGLPAGEPATGASVRPLGWTCGPAVHSEKGASKRPVGPDVPNWSLAPTGCGQEANRRISWADCPCQVQTGYDAKAKKALYAGTHGRACGATACTS